MKYQIKQKCWEVKYGKKSIFSYYMILALLSGIPHLIDGICARSMTEVNYGIVGFPIFIGIWSFYKYKKTE